MRAIIFALAMLPVAVHAQETTLPTPTEPVAQSCPVGMTFNAATQSCGLTPAQTPTPAVQRQFWLQLLWPAREVTS